ncbi:MAG: hypothetical protein QOI69_1157 [Pseudonocardiales bacterium]|nr:hypothetical protein [Pseudonocardiales bacterium]
MLGRKDYTQGELDQAKAAIDRQLVAYRELADAVSNVSDPGVTLALAALEPVLFDNMVLVLDRYFVHRLRTITGKDGNPLNEVELLTDSLMNNDGLLRPGNVVKYKPEESVLGLTAGERISVTADQFEQLATAFFADLEAKFL